MLPLYGSLSIIIIVYTISRISFATRIINNSLAQIHPELEEAAFVGGLPLFQVMRKILLPLLKPALVYAWLWMALLCYRELTMASVLVTSQENVTLPMIVWGLWLGGSLNQAAAANLVVLAFMLPAVLLYLAFRPAQPFHGGVVISITGLRKNFQSGDRAIAALAGIDLEVAPASSSSCWDRAVRARRRSCAASPAWKNRITVKSLLTRNSFFQQLKRFPLPRSAKSAWCFSPTRSGRI